MLHLHEISYDKCLPLWEQLWNARVSPIEPTSAMILPEDRTIRAYSNEIGPPTFLGVFDGSYLIGVNSYHDVGEQQRSRGLFVLPEYRGQGVGLWLLKETLSRRDPNKLMFSFPKEQALTTYTRAGFKVTSERMFDFHENKANYYVMS
jgi:GNAT superfamily N-acetyltransferase